MSLALEKSSLPPRLPVSSFIHPLLHSTCHKPHPQALCGVLTLLQEVSLPVSPLKTGASALVLAISHPAWCL